MIRITLQKNNGKVLIKDSGYILTWVYTPTINGKKHFFILPCAKFELQPNFFISPQHFEKMKLFISNSRNLLNSKNKNVQEFLFYDNQWQH